MSLETHTKEFLNVFTSVNAAGTGTSEAERNCYHLTLFVKEAINGARLCLTRDIHHQRELCYFKEVSEALPRVANSSEAP